MATLYLREIENFLQSDIYKNADFLVRENRVYHIKETAAGFRAHVLGREPLPMELQLFPGDQSLEGECSCSKFPCIHLAGLIKKLQEEDRLPLLKKLDPPPPVPSREELHLDQGELFGGLELFSPLASEQRYQLEFQLFWAGAGTLQIRPANRHLLPDGTPGNISFYRGDRLTRPPGLVEQNLIDRLQKGEHPLTEILSWFQERNIPLVFGQTGEPVTLMPAERFLLSFPVHSFIPGRGILFLPMIQVDQPSSIQLPVKHLLLEKDGVLLFQEETKYLAFLPGAPREKSFLQMLLSKSKGVFEKELVGLDGLRERFKAEKVELRYSLEENPVRRYEPVLVIQLDPGEESLRLRFIFRYRQARIAAQDIRDYFPAKEEDQTVLCHRNRELERDELAKCTSLLEDEITYQRGYYADLVSAESGEDLRLKLNLPEFLQYYGEELIQLRLELEWKDRPLSYQSRLQVQLQQNQDWLEIQAMSEDMPVEWDEDLDSLGLIKVKEGYRRLNEEELQLLTGLRRQGLDQEGNLETSSSNLPLLEMLEENIDGPLQEKLSDLRELSQWEEDPEDPPQLEGFQATLRHYQEYGLQWLRYLHSKGLKGCLADDMGLGKTVQTLALIHHLRLTGLWKPSLLIGPVVTLANWEAEAARFTPELKVLRHQGGNRARELEELEGADLILSSYQTIRNDVELFAQRDFFYLILDEAHMIKNAASQTFQAVRNLRSHHRLSLTGTPIENNTLELWSQMSFLNPGLLGSLRDFQMRFALPIEREGDEKAAELLRKTVYPFILRRTKEEVATDLPPREEIQLKLEMTPAQREIYQEMKDIYRSRVKGLLDSQGRQQASIEIFSFMLKLRQLAIYPPMAGEEYQDVNSCKMDALSQLMEEILQEDHKVLVFSQFLGTLQAARRICESNHWGYSLLTGKTEDREEQIERFQKEEDTQVFLLSLKAGGVGINLTAADYVILLDPWWNPAVERQAIDRAYRIGQKRKVFVYRLISRGTIEENILQMQENKQLLADQIITEDRGLYKELSDEDIMDLFN